MRAFLAAVAGLVLAVGLALAVAAFALPDPSPADRPLQVVSPPAHP